MRAAILSLSLMAPLALAQQPADRDKAEAVPWLKLLHERGYRLARRDFYLPYLRVVGGHGVGDDTIDFLRHGAIKAAKAGLDAVKLVFAENRPVHEVFETVVDLSGASALVMGMGNIGGPGLGLARYFANRSMVVRKLRLSPWNCSTAFSIDSCRASTVSAGRSISPMRGLRISSCRRSRGWASRLTRRRPSRTVASTRRSWATRSRRPTWRTCRKAPTPNASSASSRPPATI